MSLSSSWNRSSLSFTQETFQGTLRTTAPKWGWKPKVTNLGVLWVEGFQGQWKAREGVRSQHFNREATRGHPQPVGWKKDQLMCRSQCTVKIKGLLLQKKKKKAFRISRYWQQNINFWVWGPCDCTGHMSALVNPSQATETLWKRPACPYPWKNACKWAKGGSQWIIIIENISWALNMSQPPL